MRGREREVLELWGNALERKGEFARRFPGKPYDLAAEECYLEHVDGVPVIRFQAFARFPWVNAAFSTRLGGVSRGELSSMNLSFERGDARGNVEENYRLFCESMGASAEMLVLSDQVHDTRIYTAQEGDTCGRKIEKKLKGIDGLMTDRPGVCLATSYADCVPLFFVDIENRAVAVSHSGWKGTAARMGEKTVAAMEEQFGSRREHIVAVIGPSICQRCYEVSRDVVDEFGKAYSSAQMEEIAFPSAAGEGKYQLDLWAANVLQLKEAGLAPGHIHAAGICTCCNSELLFSHRASGGRRGNLNGFISLKSV